MKRKCTIDRTVAWMVYVGMLLVGMSSVVAQNHYVFYNSTYGYLTNSNGTPTASTTFTKAAIWKASGTLGGTSRTLQSYTNTSQYLRGTVQDYYTASISTGNSFNYWRTYNDYLYYRYSGTRSYYVKGSGPTLSQGNDGDRYEAMDITINNNVAASNPVLTVTADAGVAHGGIQLASSIAGNYAPACTSAVVNSTTYYWLSSTEASTVRPGLVSDWSDAEVTWTVTTGGAYASVSSTGLVTFTANPTGNVVVRMNVSKGGYSGSQTITLTRTAVAEAVSAVITGVGITPSSASLYMGEEQVFTASGTVATTTVPAHTKYAASGNTYFYYSGTLYASTDGFKEVALSGTPAFSWALSGDAASYLTRTPASGASTTVRHSTQAPSDQAGRLTVTASAAGAADQTAYVPVNAYAMVEPVITRSGNDISLATATAGASIRYTTDGSTPTADHGTLYAGVPFALTVSPTTVKAVSVRDGHLSTVASGAYQIRVPAPVITVSPSGQATIACADGSATIRYSTDNGANWSSYSSAVALTNPQTIMAFAQRASYLNSDTVIADYIQEGASGDYVILDDREDHRWSYYQSSSKLPAGYPAAMHSPDPRNVKITYKGNGQLANGTAVSGVKVGIDAPEHIFIYFKTLEKGGNGRYAYTTIPNPFTVRPKVGSTYYGFSHWKVVSVSGGSINGSPTTVNGDTEIEFVPSGSYDTNCTSMEVVLEAVWDVAEVRTSGSFSNNYGVERMFYVFTSDNSSDITAQSKACTYTSIYPNGTYDGTAGHTATLSNRKYRGSEFTASADSRFENIILRNSSSTIDGAGYDMTIGRGVSGYNGGLCATTINGKNGASSTAVSYKLRVESGTFANLYAISGSAREHSSTISVKVVLGCDYDRAKGNNDDLSIAANGTSGKIYGAQQNRFTSSSNKDNLTFDWNVKSGKFHDGLLGAGQGGDESIYLGSSQSGTQSNALRYIGKRRIVVEGGEMASIAGAMNSQNPSGSSGNYDNDYTTGTSTDNVVIRMTGGTVRGAIYGAAAFVGAKGGRSIILTGGEVLGWVSGGANGTSTSGGELYGNTYVYVGGKVKVGSESGGNHVGGQVNSNSTYGINGADGGHVFGAGCGILPSNAYYVTNENYKLSSYTVGRVTNSNVAVADSAIVYRNIYGGGNYGYVRDGGTANVYVLGGDVKGKVFGGSSNQQGQAVNILMNGGLVRAGIYGGSDTWGTINDDVEVHVDGGQVGTADAHANIHGGGYGSGTGVDGNVSVAVGSGCNATSGATIWGDVYGGSALGDVNNASSDNTTVSLYKGTINGGLYGGGLGDADHAAVVNGKVYVKVYGGKVRATDGSGEDGSGGIFGCNNVNGAPLSTVQVDIYGTDAPSTPGSYALYAVYGGGNRAHYNGTPVVTIHGCDNSIEYVYGGGNASNVRGTDLTVYGGTIGYVFGGGNGFSESGNHSNPGAAHYNPGANITTSGTEVKVYGGTIASVFGGSNQYGTISDGIHVVVNNETEEGADPCTGAAFRNCDLRIGELYGGGNEAEINFAPVVEIASCDAYIDNLFGGAKRANYTGDLTLNVTHGHLQNVYGGNNLGGTITGDVTLNLKGGTVGNAFGGNNAGGSITGKITVNVIDAEDPGCPLEVTNVYGGGNEAAYAPSSPSMASPEVNVSHGNILGSVFGGGLGSTAVVTANPVVNIGDDVPSHYANVDNNVYGGGSLARVVGNTTVNVQSENAMVANNVFGAGRGSLTDTAAALVKGNATVNVSAGLVRHNVYGGGEMSSVGDFAFRSASELASDPDADLTLSSTAGGVSAVNVSGGQIGDEELDNSVTKDGGYVFGGGLGRPGPDYRHHAFSRATAVNISGSAYVTASVFGGAENGHVYDSTNVHIGGGTVGQEISPRQYMMEDPNTGVSRWLYFGNVYGGGRGVDGAGYVPDTLTEAQVEGLTLGTDYRSPSSGVYIRLSQVEGDSLVPHYSMSAGQVRGNTRVLVDGTAHVVRNVYGGGSLASVGMPTDDNTGHAYVTVRGNALVGLDTASLRRAFPSFTLTDALGVERGWGAELPDSVKSDGVETVRDLLFQTFAGRDCGRVFGSGRGEPGMGYSQFSRMAYVKYSHVSVSGNAQVQGSVFGGGENGHVRKDTEVQLSGGQVGIPLKGDTLRAWPLRNFTSDASLDTLLWGVHWESETGVGPTLFRGNVYGGGRGVDTVVEHTANRLHSSTAGRVYGNTNIHISDSAVVCHAVFGGGSLASVGDTVHMDGMTPRNSQGVDLSSLSAPNNQFHLSCPRTRPDGPDAAYTIADTAVYDSTRVYMSGDPVGGTGLATIVISGGRIGQTGINEGRVYGSGRGVAGDRTHFAEVMNMAFCHNTNVHISGTADVRGAVFGGGANGHVMQNSYVRMSGGTVGVPLPLADRKVDDQTGYGRRVYRGNLYGGGRGVDPVANVNHLSVTAGRVYGNVKVAVTGGKVYHSVFGGGSLASVGSFILDTVNKAAYLADPGNVVPEIKHHYIRGTGNTNVWIKGTAWIGHDAADIESEVSDAKARSFTYTNGERRRVAYASAAEYYDSSLALCGYTAAQRAGMSFEQKKAAYVQLGYKYLGSNSGMVFGSGRGVAALENGSFDRDYAEAAFANNTFVTIGDANSPGTTDKAVVCGSVFGGGENGHVKHNTLVTIEKNAIVGGIPLHDGEFTSNKQIAEADNFQFSRSATDIAVGLVYEDSENELGVGPNVYRGNVYGGGRGVDHKGDRSAVEGFSSTAGRVYGNTRVNVTGGNIFHNVYGGGSIASVGTYELHTSGDYVDSPKKALTIKSYGGGSRSGDLRDEAVFTTGGTTVNISGGYIGRTGKNEGSVFGGGRGIAGSRLDQVTHLAFCNTSLVKIDSGARVMGSVFGGGANGHVLDSTMVHIAGGVVGHALEASDTLTTRYGYSPRTVFRGNVYGGGRGVDPAGSTGVLSTTAGRVYGNTHVLMTGGWVQHSLFGGGSMASVGFYESMGSTQPDGLQWEDSDGVIHKLSEASTHDDSVAIMSNAGRAWIEIRGGWVGARPAAGVNRDYTDAAGTVSGTGGEGRNNGRVFGSCRGTAGENFDQLAYVNITRVIIGDAATGKGPDIMGCVFGSGENGHVLDSTLVQMYGGNIGRLSKVSDWKRTYIGNLYGGGRGVDFDKNRRVSSTAGWVHNTTRVEMNGGHVWHNIYGGGSLASVGHNPSTLGYEDLDLSVSNGRSTVVVKGGKIGSDGELNGNIFGSGRGRAGLNIDTLFSLTLPEGALMRTAGGKDYYYLRRQAAGHTTEDSIVLLRVKSVLNPAVDSIYQYCKTDGSYKPDTVHHDFSLRTYVCNSKVVIDYPADSLTGASLARNTIHGSVYGSGDNGHVHHNSYVYFHNGYAGTSLAPVKSLVNPGNDSIMNGSGSVYGSGRGEDLTGVLSLSPRAGRVYGDAYVYITGGTLLGNVYGGGRMASVGSLDTTWAGGVVGSSVESVEAAHGNTYVYVVGGTVGSAAAEPADASNVGGNVYGSSRGAVATGGSDDIVRRMAITNATHVQIGGSVTIGATTYNAGATVAGSVFGGGEDGHVFGNTDVEILSGGTVGAGRSGNGYSGHAFAGGRGSSASYTAGQVIGSTAIDMVGGTVQHDIYGAGLTARVDGSTVVTLTGGTVGGDVYGGGQKDTIDGTTTVYVGTAEQVDGGVVSNLVVGGSVFGCNNIAGTPKGNANVHVHRTAHGATAAANAYPVSPVIVTQDDLTANEAIQTYALSAVYGGGNHAPYQPAANCTTTVHIYHCAENTIGDVYSGGNAADVGSDAVNATGRVIVDGGRIHRVFGGGNGAGVGNPGANIKGSGIVDIHGGLIDQVFGGSNTLGTVDSMVLNIDNDRGAEGDPCDQLVGEVFNGGNQAPLYGNGSLTVACGAGHLGDVYGGANQAPIGSALNPASLTLNIEGGEIGNVYGGSRQADIYGSVTVNVHGGSIDTLYGGNNVSGNISDFIQVNVNFGGGSPCADPRRLNVVYGGGNNAGYAPTAATALAPNFSPRVNILNVTAAEHLTHVYGGGRGSGAEISKSNPMVVIGDSTNASHTVVIDTLANGDGGVYGGGDAADVGTSTNRSNPHVFVVTHPMQPNTTVLGNVYGGGRGATATIKGDPQVRILGLSEIKGNVYGGGNAGPVQGNPDVKVGYRE